MTLARIRATGRGRIAARLSIDGQARQWVSSNALEQTLADGRVRTRGLELRSLKWGVRADLARATLEADSCQITIADFGGLATAVFAKRPQATTYVTVDHTTAVATITVLSTAAFASSGVIYLGTEAVKYTGVTATTFTGCTRGHWDTIAQAHFASAGSGLYATRVTDVPQSLEGQRCRISLYGDGDSVTGDGTQEYLGICTTGARYERGLWSFTVDPLTRLLQQSIGRDISEPVPIRGVYYSDAIPLVLALTNSATGYMVRVVHVGFDESQEAFCSTLTTKIAAAITAAGSSWVWGSGSSIVAQPSADARGEAWGLAYIVGSGAPVANVSVEMWSDIDHGMATSWVSVDTGDFAVPAAGRTLWRGVYSGPVPRAALLASYARRDFPERPPGPGYVETPSATGNFRTVYLGGLVVPTTGIVGTYAPEGDYRETVTFTVSAVDTTNRSITVDEFPFRVLGVGSRFRLGRALTTGTVSTLRSYLISASPGLVNSGGLPLIGSGDITENGTDITDAATSRLGANRVFVAYDQIVLGDIIEHELRAIGCAQRFNQGALEWFRVTATVATDTPTWTIGADDLIGWTPMERGRYGVISRARYLSGWDPVEDEHRGAPIEVVDVSATSGNRHSVALEIAQRSYPAARVAGDARTPEAAWSDVVRAVMPALGLYGTEYEVLSLTLGMRYYRIKVGDTVSITSTLIPATDGTMGVSSVLGLVLGHSLDLSTMRVQVEVLRHGQRFAGYAPGLRVASQSNIAGNQWDITVTLTGYTDESTVATWLQAGDSVRVTEGDAAAPTQVTGTVDSIQSATVVRVTFGGVWTPGAVEWSLRTRDAGDYTSTAHLAAFCFESSTAARLAYSGSAADSQVFA